MSGGVQDPYDYLFKFLVIGSAGIGKSCLLHLLTLLIFCVSAASKPKPNIVIILTDDQVQSIITRMF